MTDLAVGAPYDDTGTGCPYTSSNCGAVYILILNTDRSGTVSTEHKISAATVSTGQNLVSLPLCAAVGLWSIKAQPERSQLPYVWPEPLHADWSLQRDRSR
jgi:hypothetical protein